jgi:hypothetical protein
MKVTNKLIKDLNPCEDRFNNYLKFYSNRNPSKAQFLGLKNITHEDKLWVAFRSMPEQNISLAAADIAGLVLHFFETKYPNDNRPRKAIEAARLNTDARAAAYAANAAAYAANAAADAAAYAAADAAAYAAAYAARAAAYAADAAYDVDVATYAARAAADAARAAADAVYLETESSINKKIRTIVLKYWK